jgi:hypothetical protein
LLRFWIDRAVESKPDSWLFPSEAAVTPVSRDNLWDRVMKPRLRSAGLDWANFQVMRRTFATLSRQSGVDAHTRSAQMGNTVDVNENEYAVSSFEDRLAAVRRLEATTLQQVGRLLDLVGSRRVTASPSRCSLKLPGICSNRSNEGVEGGS